MNTLTRTQSFRLFKMLSQQIKKKGRALGKKEWVFPNGESLRARVWEVQVASGIGVLFSAEDWDTKWAIPITYASPFSKTLSPIFEFDISKGSNRRLNFQFVDEGPKRVGVRCYGSFTKGRAKLPSRSFFSFLRRNYSDVRIEKDENENEYLPFFQFHIDRLPSQFKSFSSTVADFSAIVLRYKKRNESLPEHLKKPDFRPEYAGEISYIQPEGERFYKRQHGDLVNSFKIFLERSCKVTNNPYDILATNSSGKQLIVEGKIFTEETWKQELYTGIGQLCCYRTWHCDAGTVRALLLHRPPQSKILKQLTPVLRHEGIALIWKNKGGSGYSTSNARVSEFCSEIHFISRR